MKKFGCLFAILAFSFVVASEKWAHIELGAGNYGEEGHTKRAVERTLDGQIEVVDSEFLDMITQVDGQVDDPQKQYALLFSTLDQLVQRYGSEGIFHVNDLIEEYSDYAAKCLQEYANSRGYFGITIESIPGDYTLIDPKETLAETHLDAYSSVHLKNPECSFYFDRILSGQLFYTTQSIIEGRERLQRLANLSDKGLYFFVLFHRDFIPETEMAYMEEGTFYQKSEAWQPVPYYFPGGEELFAGSGRVFYIPANNS